MADPEHLEILQQGVEAWNQWRGQHPEVQPDLSEADLRNAALGYVDFSGAYLSKADLSYARLSAAKLSGVDLRDAFLLCAGLNSADLTGAQLNGSGFGLADLRWAKFSRADLRRADLNSTNLSNADLSHALLGGANLEEANLSETSLTGADMTGAGLSRTIFAGIDFRGVSGLENVEHRGPSEISVGTIYRSQGLIPVVFLRGCGFSDWQIESAKLHQPGLGNEEITNILYRIHDLRAHQAIQINPLFISYSHADSTFVDEVEQYLNEKGIRFWRDVHHATAGRLERQIDRAIRLNPTVLLVLSKHSIESDWVQHEARLARKVEIETKRDVLCPVALDDSWKSCGWPERLREQIMEYNILDFSGWKNIDKFRRMFTRLLDGLDLFYK